MEQMLQAQKAAFLEDDLTHSRVMKESNPYKIKKLGSRVRKFDLVKWRCVAKQVAYTAVNAKFEQNSTLLGVLLNTGNAKLGESSTDDYWGTGLHLYHCNAMDRRFWLNQGGMISEIYDRIRTELKK